MIAFKILKKYRKFFVSISYFSLAIIFTFSIHFWGWVQISNATNIKSIKELEPISDFTLAQNSNNPLTLVTQGQDLYQRGNYLEAIEVWQQAKILLQSQGDILNQALVLSNLSSAYQQLGNWQSAEQTIKASLQLLQTNGNNANSLPILAQVWNTQGNLYLALSQPQKALDAFKKANSIYTQINDQIGILRSQINQAQAWENLGFYRRAFTIFNQLYPDLKTQSDSALKAVALRNYGDILRVIGNLEEAEEILTESLAVAKQISSPQDTAIALFNLGNTALAQENLELANKLYQQAIATSSEPNFKIKVQLEQLDLLLKTQPELKAQKLVEQLQTEIPKLILSRSAVYTRINFAQTLLKHRESLEFSPSEIAQLLITARQQARDLNDQRAEAYSLGYLGELYLQDQNSEEAQELTTKALLIAQEINATDLAYLWQRQLGKIAKIKGNQAEAIAAYTSAVNDLQSLRQDLVAINPEIQFQFRENVEPIYRELVDLLLQPNTNAGKVEQTNIIQARNIIESLQLAELENFFQEACLVPQQEIDQVIDQTKSAAVIYPIILENRLETIVKLPNQPLQHYATSISQNKIETILEQLRSDLTKPYTFRTVQASASQIYDWLIRPLETELTKNRIKTLVFVLDGSLRNLPMGVLYDGDKYLLEKYAIAVVPGLRLIDPNPLNRGQLTALAGGLSEARHGFSPLNFVNQEVDKIKSTLPTTAIINQEFTESNLEEQIDIFPFPIVHLATHGQFSSKAEETFILAWDQPIKINQLNRLLRPQKQIQSNAIELLVLSACETAKGDKRAALGLAGVAVRAGTRSTLASLWNLDDESGALLTEQFYRQLLDNKLTKAEALRQAQLSLLQNPRYQHPRYWSSFVLVGNWL